MARHDDNQAPLAALLTPAEVRELCTLSPLLGLAHLALEWAAIATVAAFAWSHMSPLVYVLAVVLIGARQHSLIVLMHEGAHYRLLPSRLWNDLVAEVFTAFPFFLFTMRDYRRNHLRHHRHLNTSEDPDWVRKQGDAWTFPKPRAALSWMLLKDIIGVGFAQFLMATLRLPKRPAGEGLFSAARWAFAAVVLGAVVGFGLVVPFLLLWVVPMMTWMQLAFRLRSISEHHGIIQAPSAYSHTRTILVSPLERLLLGCKNVNYHLEHHLYPGVPFYRLAALHRRLMAEPAYRDGAAIRRGYWGVLRECCSRPESGGRAVQAEA
jgi:fatty acid desaturase